MKAICAIRRLARGLRQAACLAALAVLPALPGVFAFSSAWAEEAAPGAPEAEVKAAFLINFIKYAEWPEGHLRRPAMRACVGGSRQTLDALAAHAGRPVKGLPLEAKAVEPGDALEECHALYVAKPGEAAWRQAVTRLAEKPVLVVVDMEYDAMGLPVAPSVKDGWVLRIELSGKRLLFDANLPMAANKGLSISSQLLKLARHVEK